MGKIPSHQLLFRKTYHADDCVCGCGEERGESETPPPHANTSILYVTSLTLNTRWLCHARFLIDQPCLQVVTLSGDSVRNQPEVSHHLGTE